MNIEKNPLLRLKTPPPPEYHRLGATGFLMRVVGLLVHRLDQIKS